MVPHIFEEQATPVKLADECRNLQNRKTQTRTGKCKVALLTHRFSKRASSLRQMSDLVVPVNEQVHNCQRRLFRHKVVKYQTLIFDQK